MQLSGFCKCAEIDVPVRNGEDTNKGTSEHDASEEYAAYPDDGVDMLPFTLYWL